MPSAQMRYSILEANMGGTRLIAPPPPRLGRTGDFAAGEWDDYFAMDDAVRRFIRRNLCSNSGGFAPDQIAADMGMWVNDFWRQLELAVKVALDNRPTVAYDDSSATVADLVGPAEAADFLGVAVNTIAQWRLRSDRGQIDPPFPNPVAELSGRKIWDVRSLEQWALETYRLEYEDAAGF